MEFVEVLKAKLDEVEKLANEIKARNIDKKAQEIEDLVVERLCRIAGISKDNLYKEEYGEMSSVAEYDDVVSYKHSKLEITINRTLLKTILHKAIRKEENITVTVREEAGQVSFIVKDNDSRKYVIDAILYFI